MNTARNILSVFVILAAILGLSGIAQAAGFTNNTGTATVLATSPSGPYCNVSPSSSGDLWNLIYDDGTLRKYQRTIHFESYTTVVHKFRYVLSAPGWFDEAKAAWNIYQWSGTAWTWKMGAVASTGGFLDETRLSARYNIGTHTQTWKVFIQAQGLDWGSQTCYKAAEFYLYDD